MLEEKKFQDPFSFGALLAELEPIFYIKSHARFAYLRFETTPFTTLITVTVITTVIFVNLKIKTPTIKFD